MILHVLVHAQRCSDSESEYSFSTPPRPNGDTLRLHLATSIINSPVSLRACLIALGTRTVDSEVFQDSTGTLISETGDGSTSTRSPSDFKPKHNADSSSTDDLREDFRNLSLLLTVATAINNPAGHPTLSEDPLLDADLGGRINYAGDEFPDSTVMHAVTTILVLEHKVIAGMSSDRSRVLVTEDDLVGDHYKVVVDEDGERYTLDLLGVGQCFAWHVTRPVVDVSILSSSREF
jgi:hypothetical protein